jgi:hypothetical protein
MAGFEMVKLFKKYDWQDVGYAMPVNSEKALLKKKRSEKWHLILGTGIS